MARAVLGFIFGTLAGDAAQAGIGPAVDAAGHCEIPVAVVAGPDEECLVNLGKVVCVLDGACGSLSSGEGRQEESDEQRDDRDHNEQLHEGESVSSCSEHVGLISNDADVW